MAIQSILFVSGAACGFKMAAPLSLGVAPVGTPSPATPPLLLPRHRLTSRVSSASPRLSLVDADDWQELESRLPSVGGEGATTPVLTLYRDTNGWCPFCERVWFQLSLKGIPYEEELIPLQDKPAWYKEMVPTTLVPAVKFADDSAVVWESLDIMRELERRFPQHTPMMPSEGTEAHTRAEELIEHASTLSSAGAKFAFSARNTSISDVERATFRGDFVTALGELDAAIRNGGGPFIAGEKVSLVDAVYVPFLERWAVQLPLTHNLSLRGQAEWPHLDGWYKAMEALPPYEDRVRGDRYSWAATVGTFQRMFANGTLSEAANATIARAEHAAAKELVDAALLHEGDAPTDPHAAVAAATKLVRNRQAVVADAVSSEPKTQRELKRLEADEAEAVELVLAECATRLLALAEAGGDADATAKTLRRSRSFLGGLEAPEAVSAARAAKYVAARLCAPRDLGASAAALLRATLRQVETEAERYAWSASGGLL